MARTERLTEALDAVLELTVLLGADMESSLAEQGLTPARTHLLWVLQQHGPSPQRALADALSVTPRNVTGLVDALEDTGFVTRQPHPTDRRVTLVTLTEHGAATTERMAAEHRDLARQLFAGLPRERFDCFVTGLSHVLERVQTLVAAEGARRG